MTSRSRRAEKRRIRAHREAQGGAKERDTERGTHLLECLVVFDMVVSVAHIMRFGLMRTRRHYILDCLSSMSVHVVHIRPVRDHNAESYSLDYPAIQPSQLLQHITLKCTTSKRSKPSQPDEEHSE